MLKKLATVFVLAFLLNWVWEMTHSVLYLNYQGRSVTYFILFRAALGDAVIISVLILIAHKFKLDKLLFVVFGGLIAAIAIEMWALQTGRWAYNSLMPIIPIIKTGLTPTIQLAVTGYIVQKLTTAHSERNSKRNYNN